MHNIDLYKSYYRIKLYISLKRCVYFFQSLLFILQFSLKPLPSLKCTVFLDLCVLLETLRTLSRVFRKRSNICLICLNVRDLLVEMWPALTYYGHTELAISYTFQWIFNTLPSIYHLNSTANTSINLMYLFFSSRTPHKSSS